MRGPSAGNFSTETFETLFSSFYTVSPSSDRMGLRLQGPAVSPSTKEEIPSQGVTSGGMQVPADGQPILLLADRGTAGGYPRIATVIGADLPAAGRLAAGMTIKFQEVSREEALHALKKQREWLASLPSELRPPDDHLSTEHLLAHNLIGGVTAGHQEELV
jgi:allophanate hydrolase subunit 2